MTQPTVPIISLLSLQEPSVLPRNKVLSTAILATTETRGKSENDKNENRRIDPGSENHLSEEGQTTGGGGKDTAINIYDQSSSPPPSFSSYGKKIPEMEEEGLIVEEANVDQRVFADEDLELVVGLVKPLVAQLKAGGAAGDQTEPLLQNSLEGAELPVTVIPSNGLEDEQNGCVRKVRTDSTLTTSVRYTLPSALSFLTLSSSRKKTETSA